MKKFLTLTIAAVQLFIFSPAFSAVYEASTLHNSVSRAETVQDLYMKRWGVLKDKNFYFDIYGKINWVFNFDVNTYNAGKDKTEATDLRLVRSYGSMTLAIPLGSYREKPEDSDMVLALTTTGFHYGLTKNIDVDRGSGIASSSISDYKHSQFFDDIYAATFMYRPYFTIHAGLIYNNEYVPNEDGSMSYFDPVKSYNKKFIAVEVYSFMAFSMNIADGKPESTKTEIAVNPLVGFVADVSSIFIPKLYIGYERTAAYNDELFDSVWVSKPKDTTTGYEKDSAMLNILSVKVNQRISQLFTIEGFYAAQYIKEDIYFKTDNEKITPSITKEWYLTFNLDPVELIGEAKVKAYTGMSWYWDPAIGIHRNSPGKGKGVYGWVLGGEVNFENYGADFLTEINYSTELKKLMETTDKWAVEGSIFFRI